MATELLYGIHDPGGEALLPKGGWIVFAEAIGCDSGDQRRGDYRRWSDAGYNVIVRLNNGYGATGTIPLPARYADFAARCANYIANSPGCTRWIIGNEPNHAQEWPGSVQIGAAMYVECFRAVAQAVRARVGGHSLIPAPVAPWNVQAGDWVTYQREVWEGCAQYAGGLALHTYTHGADPALITSEATMGAPYDNRRYHFRAYQDLLAVVPPALRGLPVYITETDQDAPWLDRNTGWVQAAYAEINAWNQRAGAQKIHCLALYRWPNYDQWGFANKSGVHDDLRAAVAKGYGVAVEETPVVSAPVVPLPGLAWDARLTARGVTLQRANGADGALVYRLVRGEFRNTAESGGRHHIYVDVLNEAGKRLADVPVKVWWADGSTVLRTELKAGEEAACNFPMYASGNSYSVCVAVLQSDIVTGMGLGDVATPHMGDHVSYVLVFQRGAAVAPAEPPAEQPTTVYVPIIETGGNVSTPTPQAPSGIVDPRVAQAIITIESGGKSFGADGRVLIRFEAHIFKAQLGNDEAFAQCFRYGTPAWTDQEMYKAGAWWPIHTGLQAREWDAFEAAKKLNPDAAAQSISMGAPQAMGFNHARLGYPSALAMLHSFESAPAQLVAFLNFLLSDPALWAAVRAKDWREIAKRYNGAGNVETYAALLQKAYESL